MSALPFDTLAHVRRLEAAGVPRREAEAHADTIAALIKGGLVTRDYLDARLNSLLIKITAAMAAGACVLGAALWLLSPTT